MRAVGMRAALSASKGKSGRARGGGREGCTWGEALAPRERVSRKRGGGREFIEKKRQRGSARPRESRRRVGATFVGAPGRDVTSLLFLPFPSRSSRPLGGGTSPNPAANVSPSGRTVDGGGHRQSVRLSSLRSSGSTLGRVPSVSSRDLREMARSGHFVSRKCWATLRQRRFGGIPAPPVRGGALRSRFVETAAGSPLRMGLSLNSQGSTRA